MARNRECESMVTFVVDSSHNVVWEDRRGSVEIHLTNAFNGHKSG
jgi:hypothetical protein